MPRASKPKQKDLAPALEKDLALIREVRRDRLHPIEEARVYEKLAKTLGTSNQRELAKYVGVSQARVSQRLSLLEMPKEVTDLMLKGDHALTERHARAIRRLPDPKLQVWLAKRIHKEQLTVEITASIVTGMLEEMGVQTRRSSRWNSGPGVRWRLTLDTLELHVQGADHAARVEALKRFLASYKKG